MKCPNCNHTGNLLKRPFVRRRGLPDTYCVKCGAHIKLNYRWLNILLLTAGIVVFLLLLHLILKSLSYPGVSSMMAASITGVVLVVFMQRSPFVIIEHIKYTKKKK